MNIFEFEFFNPVRVVFGMGKLSKLGEETSKISKSAMVVSYKDSTFIAGVLRSAEESLREAGVKVCPFYEFEQNPDISTVSEGAKFARENGCGVVIGIGGGSAMDAAKAVAAAVCYEGDLWNMVAHSHSGSGNIKPPSEALPIICVPTLPATGSEMNMTSVLSNRKLGRKSYIWAECLFPKISILDPSLTFSVPRKLTALACADAISHALEIYINSRDGTPLQTQFQESVMRVSMEYVKPALENPNDAFARANLMWAATCAINGWAYPGDGWTPIHQVGHVLTSKFGISHGASISSLMPAWMRYNSKRRPEVYEKFAENVMGVDAIGKTRDEIASEGIEKFERFLSDIGVPVSIFEFGIGENKFDEIISGVRTVSFNADGVLSCNPIMTESDIRNVLKLSLEMGKTPGKTETV